MSRSVDRRTFLSGAAASAAAGYSAWKVPSASAGGPKPRSEQRRVVIIGSGFGGAITALRLAQAGVNVTILERGKRWTSGQPNTFATFSHPDKRSSWMSSNPQMSKLVPAYYPKPYAGVVERIRGAGMDIVCGAGVGGSSLAYHGMSVKPRADLFARVMPGELDYEELDRTYYPRAAQMLKISRMPADVFASERYASSRKYAGFVKKAGLPDVRPVPMTIDWDVVRREIRGELPQVISRGDVVYGVNGPGKLSLDTNYIPAAEATGRVELLPLHNVQTIRRDDKGRWVINVDRIDVNGKVQERIDFTADALFMGAGSGNTSKLLLRAGGLGHIPDLPDDLGKFWGSNGDLLTTQILRTPMGTYQGGPANVASFDWDNPEGPVTLLFAPVPLPWGEMNVMETIAMFIPDGYGSFSYDSTYDRVRLNHPPSAHGAAIEMARRRIRRLGRAAGSVASFDQTRVEPSTYHALGGAVIGKVCDAYGRVLGQRGLYVNDSALIPGSTGCVNPSLTVAALAERNIEKIVATDLGSVF